MRYRLLQELRGQLKIASLQFCNMASQLTINLICIAVVGHLSELDLAAASLSVDVYSIMGQSVIISMLGALDTQASQVKDHGAFPALSLSYVVNLSMDKTPQFHSSCKHTASINGIMSVMTCYQFCID